MPLGPLRDRILARLAPGPAPTEYDETGMSYLVHDAHVRAGRLAEPLCDALDAALGREQAVDFAADIAYQFQAVRPWEQVTVVVRTDRGVVVGTLHSKGAPEVHRCGFGELDVVRRKMVRRGPRIEPRNGRLTIELGAQWASIAQATQEAFERVARPGMPAGWHPDPSGRHRLRWWDGRDWSAHASDTAGVTVHDPL